MLHEGGITTCSCDTSSGPGASGLVLLLAALGVASLRRRARAAISRRRS
jgi:MYXO-CTERM domain-containing protein